MELVQPLEAAKKAYELLQCFREHHQHHVHIQHVSTSPTATFFLPGTDGTDIHDSVAHFEGEPLVIKHHPNSFRETNLLELLKSWDVERVIITGMMTHMCVDATARAAADFGFRVIVAEDACATRDLKYGDTVIPADHVHKAFLAALEILWSGDDGGTGHRASRGRTRKDKANLKTKDTKSVKETP